MNTQPKRQRFFSLKSLFLPSTSSLHTSCYRKRRRPQKCHWGGAQWDSSFFLLMIFCVGGGLILWLFNIQGWLLGTWSQCISALFTSIGILIAILQYRFQRVEHAISPSAHLGIVLVLMPKTHNGTELHLFHGTQVAKQAPYNVTTVVEISKGQRKRYIGVFAHIEPGFYTLSTSTRDFVTQVNIGENAIKEIDWQK